MASERSSQPPTELPDPAAGGPVPAQERPTFRIGDAVQLARNIPYLRSTDPMPMLRPPDLVDHQEVGEIVELRALGRVAVRFRRGSFLLDVADLMRISPGG